MKFIIFRYDRIGDFLLSSILINTLKQKIKDANITVVCSSKNYNYVKNSFLVDNILLIPDNFISRLFFYFKLFNKKYDYSIVLDGKKTLPAYLEVINNNRQYTNLKIILTEGKNRHIRRIAQKFELDVIKIHRTAIGPISLSTSKVDNVKLGHYRLLSSSEINTLKYLTKLFNNDM